MHVTALLVNKLSPSPPSPKMSKDDPIILTMQSILEVENINKKNNLIPNAINVCPFLADEYFTSPLLTKNNPYFNKNHRITIKHWNRTILISLNGIFSSQMTWIYFTKTGYYRTEQKHVMTTWYDGCGNEQFVRIGCQLYCHLLWQWEHSNNRNG